MRGRPCQLYRKSERGELSPQTLARDQALKNAVADLLRQLGPVDEETLRNRLLIASEQQYRRVRELLVREGIAEKLHGGLRLVGDARELPPSDLGSLWVRKQRRSRLAVDSARREWNLGAF